MTEQREQRGVFGEAVEQYEAARPGYPAELVTDVLAYAGPGPVLEVGAGTGKATVSFAAHGRELTCVEPDPRMAAVLERHCRAYPQVSVVVTRFESWHPDRRYGLLYSAQAWHWLDPDRRVDLAHAALAPGGALALFWNVYSVADTALHTALTGVDARHGLPADHTPHGHRADRFAGRIEDESDEVWPTLQLAADARFTDLRSRRYRSSRTYTTAGYLDLLTSISLYRMLAPRHREAVLAEVAGVVDAHGGVIDLAIVTDLALARRVPA